jgi:hypothetical protein
VSRAGEDAAAMVASALSRRAPKERPVFLRELLAHTAAGLVVIEGDRTAARAVEEGVEETVALSQARGAAIEKAPAVDSTGSGRATRPDRFLRRRAQLSGPDARG